MGYPIFGPPGIPLDRLDALRKALSAALADPITRQEAAKLRIDIEHVAGETIERIVQRAHASPAALVARMIEASKAPN